MFGGVAGAQMETLKVRETQPPHKAVLAVTESDGHFPSFYRHHPFLPSSPLKFLYFSWRRSKEKHQHRPPPLLLDDALIPILHQAS